MDIEQVKDLIESLPESVAKETPDLYLYDTHCSQDIYVTYNSAAEMYGQGYGDNEHFIAAGQYDETTGSINMYLSTPAETIIHEMGHRIDANDIYSNSNAWTEAMQKDKLTTGDISPTVSGETSNSEDFAELFWLFFTDASFKNKYIERTRFIQNLINQMEGGK